jgi:ABC-type nitrate/sulfonate/bicarbonate transport system substrate-binding protein
VRGCLGGLVLALVLGAGGGCRVLPARPPAPPPSGPVVRVGYIANGVAAGLGFVLEEGGLLASQRLAVSFQRYGGPEGMRRALAANDLDVALGLPVLTAARLMEEDVPVRVVAAVQRADEQVVVLANSPLQQLRELRGRAVGTAGEGSQGDLLLRTVLSASYGIAPSEVRLSTGTETQLVAQLESGTLEAAVLRGLTIDGLPERSRYRLLGDLGAEWQAATGSPVPPLVGTVTLRRGFREGYPEAAARVLAAVVLAVRWGREHPSEVAQLMMRNLRMTESNAQNYARRWSVVWEARMDEAVVAGFLSQLESLRAQGLLRDPPSPALFDPSLWPQALARVD